MNKIDLIVGARPNFMKAAPVLEELRNRRTDWEIRLIHTGQHYDEKLSDLFFRQLGMLAPDINLGIGSDTHAKQTARIMVSLEEQFVQQQPDMVVVFGDVNSTIAATLVTSKLQIRLAHVEAGLRSFDRTMPEEINRILTDAVSDILFTTETEAELNLQHEGISQEKIYFVGNTMIDTLLKHKNYALKLDMPHQLHVQPKKYVVVTLHRPSNVDKGDSLRAIIDALIELSHMQPVIFPVHPRTLQRLHQFHLWQSAKAHPHLYLLEPQGYLEFIGLIASAGAVITDSGGVQEETTILGIPCITLRANTERPITISAGTNVLVGTDTKKMIEWTAHALKGEWPIPHTPPELWDGSAATRIVNVIEHHLHH